jgi:hypothetical protein
MRRMAIAPSPTAEATRFTVPRRTSPAANTPAAGSRPLGVHPGGTQLAIPMICLIVSGWPAARSMQRATSARGTIQPPRTFCPYAVR